jgi:hypothetical protein
VDAAGYERGVAQRKTLTEAQVALLRWISEGCPDGQMESNFHRISAAALRRRGLLAISGRGPTWTATITDSGREYLKRVNGPEPPIPRQGNVPVTQQLVDNVIAAGGSLRVPRRWVGDPTYVDYRNRAALAERYGKVPDRKRLEVVDVDEGLEIRLVDVPEKIGRAELVEVIVPEKVTRYHPVAKRFREDRDRHEVSRGQVQRAARIVHAIAKEAERRNWSVEYSGPPDGKSWRDSSVRASGSRLAIDIEEHELRFRLHEKGVHEKGPWEQSIKFEQDRALRWGSTRREGAPSGSYDAEATGVLELELEDERRWKFLGRQRQHRWGDRASWRLEDRLSHLFREIQERIVEAELIAEEERIEAERAAEAAGIEAAQREKQWNELMEGARRQLAERGRIVELRAQVASWQESECIHGYCDAMEEAHGDDPRCIEWIGWAREFAARLNPLREAPSMPDLPEETPEALQEFLPDGWSARGPEYGHQYPWGAGRLR